MGGQKRSSIKEQALPTKPKGAITELLQVWSEQGKGGEARLLEDTYAELRRLSAVLLSGERIGHSLAPSDLIHEVYFRLQGRRQTAWQGRRHFFATACQCMRRILIEHARKYARPKHGGGYRPLSLEESFPLTHQRPPDLLALDDALRGLEQVDPFKARLVELRFFGGFSIPETAKIMGSSHATIERHWRLARAWLYREIPSGTTKE